jgi:hypothetical protein
MPGHPEEGDVFKPEDLFPLVDETAEIVKAGKTVVTPAGQFTEALKVRESTLLSDEIEYKWYAPGPGVIKAAAKGETLHLLELIDTGSAEDRDALVQALIQAITGEDSVE